MDTPSLVMLGVIAAASLAQAGSLLAIVLVGRRIARGVGDFERSLEREVEPALQEAMRLTRGLAEISAVTAAQARRVSDVLDAAASSVARTGAVLTEAVLPSAVRVATAVSVSRAALELLGLYRRRGAGS
jgi:hypothetical protein